MKIFRKIGELGYLANNRSAISELLEKAHFSTFMPPNMIIYGIILQLSESKEKYLTANDADKHVFIVGGSLIVLSPEMAERLATIQDGMDKVIIQVPNYVHGMNENHCPK